MSVIDPTMGPRTDIGIKRCKADGQREIDRGERVKMENTGKLSKRERIVEMSKGWT